MPESADAAQSPAPQPAQPPITVQPAALPPPTGSERAPLNTGASEPIKLGGDADRRNRLSPLRVFGYIQVHYRHAIAAGVDANVDNGDFRVQRARIGVKGDVFSWLGYDLEIDPRAPEITGVLRDAFIALRFIPRHELRLGQQKTQFGYENRESSSQLYAVNRTEVSDNLSRGGVTLRDIGVGLLGDVKLGSGLRIEDALTVVNGDGMNTQADSTKMKDIWGRVGCRYKSARLANLDVRLGVSGGIGDYIDEGDDPLEASDDFRLEFRRLGADVEVDHNWFFVSSEYVWGRDEDTVSGESTDRAGYYLNVVGKTPWRVGPIVRYDALGDDFERWTFGSFYGLADASFRMMLNYEYRKQRDGERADDKFYVWAQARF